MVETGKNGLMIKKYSQELMLEWTDIVGANKLFGFIFLRSGEAIYLSRNGYVKLHDYDDRDIGEGEFSVHIGWTMFVEILKKNVIANGGTFIDEFEGLYVSVMMAFHGYSHWKCKVSPEEAKDRKVLLIFFGIIFIYFLSFFSIQIFVFGGERMSPPWGLTLFLSNFFIIGFAIGYFAYYLRMGKAFKILERHLPKNSVGEEGNEGHVKKELDHVL